MASSSSKPGPLVAPLLLRVVLGGTFVWAGLGKLVPTIEYKGGDAAILANLGTGIAPTTTLQSKPTATGAEPGLAPPASLPLPAESPSNKPSTPPKNKPSSRQPRPGPDITSVATPMLASFATEDLPAAADTARTKTKSAASKSKQNIQPAPGTTPSTPTPPAANHQTPPVTPPATPASRGESLPPGGRYAAADFPEPARARRAYTLSVMMVRAANPQPVVGAPTPKPFWPQALGSSPWVVWLAFGVAVTELFAGVLLMVGFLTRLSAMMLIAVMCGALWLTQIGPAYSIGQTTFGILPDKTWWDPQLWTGFFWQVLIITSALAVALMGAGALSVDRALAIIGSGGPKAEQDPAPKP